MNFIKKSRRNLTTVITFISALTLSNSVMSNELSPLVDSFENNKVTNFGQPRMLLTDTTAGGKTIGKADVTNGTIHLSGNIVPPRGQPGWSSLVLPLSPMGKPQDVSQFSGIRLSLKVNSGNISVSANSLDITNFDYHSAQVAVSNDGNFHEVKIPFKSMKRIWSEQTELNPKTLNSLSIVAYSPQKATFDFIIDEVSFY